MIIGSSYKPPPTFYVIEQARWLLTLPSSSSAPVSGMRLLQAAWSVSLPRQMNAADCHTAVSAVTAVQLIEVLTRASVWEWGAKTSVDD